MVKKSSNEHEPSPPVSQPQRELFTDTPTDTWPAHSRNPYNFHGRTVQSAVEKDLLRAHDTLLITGYTALDRVVAILADSKPKVSESTFRLRVLIGHEPSPARNTARLSRARYTSEIAEYWLARGFSIIQCAKVISALEVLRSPHVEARTSDRLPVHAKVYCTEDVVTGGSSNYSRLGMEIQVEANWRFTRHDELVRFEESRRFAEAIWSLSIDYKEDLLQLLEQLLQPFTWQEALARACEAIIEGTWIDKYLKPETGVAARPLWPSQSAGIAQALWLLENAGSVLIADATGSGKTRMGVYLIRAAQIAAWRKGKVQDDFAVLIAPPYLQSGWRSEAIDAGIVPHIASSGVLSAVSSADRATTVKALYRAQTLAIDEAHNYLNRLSNRTQAIYGNLADHVLLFTATPINRGAHDLLPIVDLLGADNFDDDVLAVVQKLWRRRTRNGKDRMTESERSVVTSAIQRFTIRRTKRELNRLITESPELYHDAFGRECKYPRHEAITYELDEPTHDRQIARQIRALAQQLTGLINLRETLRMPPYLLAEGWTEEGYLKTRLTSAAALSRYRLADTLRSSRAALMEHLHGTDLALAKAGIENRLGKKATGDTISLLERISGSPPGSELSVEVPDWLVDKNAHSQACQREKLIYEQINSLAEQLSDARENRKVNLLVDLTKKHNRILAFDSHLITLNDLLVRLERKGVTRVLLVTGTTSAARKQIADEFSLNGQGDLQIALCSDALAEGLNLQGASAVVMLDMPSVMRIAEQRVGRVDRLDSPHQSIEVYWPRDAIEFALRSDEAFVDRHRDVELLLGSNMPLPEHLSEASNDADRVIQAEAYAAAVDRTLETGSEDAIGDAFQPIRDLIVGESAIVPDHIYKAITATTAAKSAISIVRAASSWSFYAVEGRSSGGPNWFLIEYPTKNVSFDFHVIASRLRSLLQEDPEKKWFDEMPPRRIEDDLEAIRPIERGLIGNKKRKAVIELRHVLRNYSRLARSSGDSDRAALVAEILKTVDQSETDLTAVADWWLGLVRPLWHQHMLNRRRSGPALLRDLRRQLEAEPIATEALRTFEQIETAVTPLDQRVIAAIVAI